MQFIMNVAIHPVSLFNISDYLTRAKYAPGVDHTNVIGGLLGVVEESQENASIMYSFEIPDDHSLEQLVERLKLFKVVYPYLKLIGFYKVGAKESLDLRIDAMTQGLSSITDFTEHISTQLLLLLSMDESFATHRYDSDLQEQEPSSKAKVGNLPFTISVLFSTSSALQIGELKIKTLKIEKVALNTIHQATQELETMQDPYSELTRDSKTSLEIMNEKITLLLQKLREIQSGSSKASIEEQSLLVQKVGDLVSKLDMVRQSDTEDDSVPLSLINQSLLLNNLYKLSVINKSTLRLSSNQGGYPLR